MVTTLFRCTLVHTVMRAASLTLTLFSKPSAKMDHSRNGSSWVTSIPYPPSMPENMPTDRLADRLRKEEEKRPALKNLVNGEIDYSVHQRILDFGFIDSARLDKNFSEKNFGARIDFIYISPDLKSLHRRELLSSTTLPRNTLTIVRSI